MNSKNNSPSPRGVLIRCDGAPDIGLGHVVRCVALADELRDAHACKIQFLTRRSDVARQLIERAGHPLIRPATLDEPDDLWISRLINEQHPEVLVMDFRDPLTADAVRQWRNQGVLTVTIDDPEDKRIGCDLVFYPPVPQARRLSWGGFSGELLVGWEWVLLRRQFAGVAPAVRQHSRPVILVTMGGSDPGGLTLKAVQALDTLEEEFETIVILGGAFCHNEALEKVLAGARRKFEILRNVSDMAAVMSRADLAVASFCVTAYELATVGVPGIYLCLTDDHAEAAQAFVDARIGVSLGVHTGVSVALVAGQVQTFLHDPALRSKLSQQSRNLMNGRGAQNVARRIMETLAKRKSGQTSPPVSQLNQK